MWTTSRAQLGIPGDAVVLLAVGRMVYKKGFDQLLYAAAALRGSRPDISPIHLVMVGSGDLWNEWQALGRQLNLGASVHWVGDVPTDRMSVFYNLADIAAMPSVSRPPTGLAVSVLDAMCCAKPVVGSDAAGNQLAIHDGVNGFVVSEGNVVALTAAIESLVDDPSLRSRMGVASRRLIDTELGWPHLAARYIAHFERLGRERRS